MTDLLAQVSAVIVSYNTVDALAQCLVTLTVGDGGAIDVVVVDNASADGSPAMVLERFPSVRLLEAGANLGLGRATNLGAQQTGREFILSLNPDCLAPPESVAVLARRLADDEALGFAGPRVRLASGAVDHAALRGDPDPIGALVYFAGIPRLFPNSRAINRYSLRHLDYGREQELVAGTAACLMFRATAFRAVGGFDEAFFMYGEDLDLCRRLREAGHHGVYVPTAEVIHLKGEATRQVSGRMLREFHHAMWTYYRKHEAELHSAPYNWLVAAGINLLAVTRLGLNRVRRNKRVSPR